MRDCDIAALRQAIAANNIDCKVSSTSNSFSSSDSDGAVGAAAVDVEEGLKETALLLLHSVLRVTCLLKLRAVPVAAPGAPAAAVFSPAPVTVSGAAVGSLAAMRASLLHKRPLASSGRKQTPAAVFSSSTSVPQLPLFRSAVKVEYPAFSVPPVYPKEAYFTSSSMTALIAKAAADSPLCTEITLRSKAAAPATAAPATSISVLSPTLSSCTCLLPPATAFPSLVRVVSHVPGPQRRPPTAHDLNIFLTAPGTIRYFHSQEEISTYCSSGCCAVHDGISGGVLGAESAEKAPGGETTATATREKEVFSLPVPVLPSPVRHDVPSVPGAMLLTGVLTPLECAQFIVAAERLGYTPDAVDGIDNVVWLADPALLGPLYQRVQSLLPQTLEGHALTGINARLRLFRYYPGAVYRPHIDGAWPGSGLNAEGIYTDDAFDGQQHSRLTFLVYLNDGFEGGTTTYFLPGDEAEVKAEAESVCGAHNSSSAGDNGDGDIQTAMEGSSGAKESASGKVGRIEVRRVKPQLGSVLVFPHGSASGSLVHEGSAVLSGVKYVIRTDVLYTSSAISSTC